MNQSVELKSNSRTESLFGEYLAFRLRGTTIEPVQHPSLPELDTLLHINSQKEVLLRNTAQFVRGFPANDVLLWGERGTGKSSLVKAMLRVFAKEGLRVIQVYKSDIPSLSILYSALRKAKFRFILFFDDLSFEVGDDSFKLLKSLLDGDIEERPENVLVYATSNRRHLIPEIEIEEKFPSESVQERISLIDRFGIRLPFYAFDKGKYLDIVKKLVSEKSLELEGVDLEREALMWAQERGGFSGRVARQFVKDLEGRLRLSHL